MKRRMRINKRSNFFYLFFSFVVFINVFISCSNEQTEDEKEILSVIDKLFKAMSEHDSDLACTVLIPEGQFYSIRENSTGIVWNRSTHREFIDRLETSEERWLERIWEAKVLSHKQIAIVWAPYDFYRNQQFSHCGIDAFNLIKTNEGWKVTGIIYTIEPEGCEQSPLGTPEF